MSWRPHPYATADPYADPTANQQQSYPSEQEQHGRQHPQYSGQQPQYSGQQPQYDYSQQQHQQYGDTQYNEQGHYTEHGAWQQGYEAPYIEQQVGNMSLGASGQQPPYSQPPQQHPPPNQPAVSSQWQQQSVPTDVIPCDPRFVSASVTAFPSTPALRLNSALPLTITIQPMAEVYVDPAYMNPYEKGPLPCVNFGSNGVVRCKACRAYVNPYCKFINGGSHWRCCHCGRTNDVHKDYFCDLDSRGQRTDRLNRIELSLSSYEIVAPAEYMVRPPQPPAFIFVIDVSQRSIQTGLLNVVCSTILAALDFFPGLPRTKIGFITFDSLVHLYSLRSSLSKPQMMVLPNLDDLFLPFPEDYLVDLEECRRLIEILLSELPAMHAETRNVECALGAATMAAFRIVNEIGGKAVFFTTSLPSYGPARLTNRDSSSAVEMKLQQPATDFYKSWGLKYTRMQVRADMFVFPGQYCDIATMVVLSQFTGGQLYTYPNFDQFASAADSLRTDLTRCITREQSWEGVLRVRVSKGAKIVGYEGNIFLRGTDLLAVPNVSADDAIFVEIGHDETSPQGIIAIQVALLYTASFGERRIRVHNHFLPVVQKIEDLFYFVDLAALINAMAKKALSLCIGSSMDKGRESIQNTCMAILSAFRKSTTSFNQMPLSQEEDYPECLRYLPMMTLALLKCPAFKESPLVSADARTIGFAAIRSMNAQALDLYLRPRIYRVDSMTGEQGIMDGAGMLILPDEINATSSEMLDDGTYLIDNGYTIFIWIGHSTSSQFLQTCFGIPSLQGVDPEKLELRHISTSNTDSILNRLQNVISFLRAQSAQCQRIQVIRQPTSEKFTPAYEEFSSCLILDRTATVMGYGDFLHDISKVTS